MGGTLEEQPVKASAKYVLFISLLLGLMAIGRLQEFGSETELQMLPSHISYLPNEMPNESANHITRGLVDVLAAHEPPHMGPRTIRSLKKAYPVMVAGQKAIYAVEDGKKHLIPDWDTFCNLGYDMGQVAYITKDELDKIPTGALVPQVAESGHRSFAKKCPCASDNHETNTGKDAQAEKEDEKDTESNLKKHARNICFLKNTPFDQLFTETFELNVLQKHLRFFLVDEEHVTRDEVSRWRLYNETVMEYMDTRNPDLKDKYNAFPTVGAFQEAEEVGALTPKEQAQAAEKKAEALLAAAEKEADAKAEAKANMSYDSDVDPYPSPYFSNGHVVKRAATELRNRNHLRSSAGTSTSSSARSAARSSSTTTSRNQEVRNRRLAEEVDENGNIVCDIIVEVLPDDFDLASHVCPGVCQPHPRAYIPKDALMPEPKNPDRDLSCSLTLSNIFADNVDEGSVSASTSTPTSRKAAEENAKDKAHAKLAMILHSIARRKMEECSEREFWLPPAHNRLHVDTIHYQPGYHEELTRRKVRGLIIWIGSISRFSMARAQIEVLQSQSNVAPNDRIIGWLATEEIYNCRMGTTTCTTLSPSLAYYNYMPTSALNVKTAGYNCAQRRPLRAMAHTLSLFDPDFLFVVDDDTFVNIDKLKLNGPLDTMIHEKQHAWVMGQLTQGRKITRNGFFYGGAGYLMGKAVIDALTSHTIFGPPATADTVRDPTQTEYLQIMYQALENAREVCPTCIVDNENNAKLESSSYGWPKTKIELSGDTRLVDACMHIMSEEHTCYASDHAISRCVIHGAYAEAIDVDCWGKPYQSSAGSFEMGMCMGIEECTDVQLTCHRWMADPADYRHAIQSAFTETDDDE